MDQLAGWADDGLRAVKMKIGRDPAADVEARETGARSDRPAMSHCSSTPTARTRASRRCCRRSALPKAVSPGLRNRFPRTISKGLRLIRDQGPAGMEIAAGEYGYDALYFRRMLSAGAVDVQQADATRCAGISGFLQADALCESHSMPLSAHSAPSIHAHACCAAQRAINTEYFFDHVRIEKMAFEGAIEAKAGALRPDLSQPGFGLVWKEQDMSQFQVFGGQVASA